MPKSSLARRARKIRSLLREARGIQRNFRDRVEFSGRCNSLVYQLASEIRYVCRGLRSLYRRTFDTTDQDSKSLKYLRSKSASYQTALSRIEDKLFLV